MTDAVPPDATPQDATPPFLTADALESPGVVHGFFGRAGGVSKPPYEGLNTGTGSADAPEAVAENRRRCAAALDLPLKRLLSVYQVHSPNVVAVDGPWPSAPGGGLIRPEADALVTNKENLALGVLAADCMPVLMVDAEARVIGAAHAGWRGALAGVLEATVRKMTDLGADPSRIIAAFGPCLRQPQFEVGLDLVDAFTAPYPEATRFFRAGAPPEKRQFDLVGFGHWRLREAGVQKIDDVNCCTLAQPDAYFSYRASRRAGIEAYGRNLSAIALKPHADA
ncbi:MAG: peptidoglycan editing factor PgeF [Pseudomonadota bacterium]